MFQRYLYKHGNYYSDFFFYNFKVYFFIYFSFYSIEKRLENFLYLKNIFDRGKNLFLLNHYINVFFLDGFFLKKRQLIRIYIFDLLFSYKGWRFFKFLPVNGQRTWTNSWTAHLLNRSIYAHKINFFKKILGYTNTERISSVIILEYYNLLWKMQWYDEWLELKKIKFYYNSKKKIKKDHNVSEDLILSELLYIRGKFLKKKVRIQFKSGFNLLGFEPGSTWNYNY